MTRRYGRAFERDDYRRGRAVQDLPLFNPEARPRVPPAAAENRVLPLEGTIEGRYQAWRRTEEGERVYEFIRLRALAFVATGATRISVNECMEAARATLHLESDNSYRSLIARDLVEAHQVLRHAIELRRRKAS